MKSRWRILSLIGIGCGSLCFLSLPLLLLLAPTVGLGWLHNETLSRATLVMFLLMSLTGSLGAFKTHRRPWPGPLALAGAGLLISAAWHYLRPWSGWSALAALLLAWAWDQYLINKVHRTWPKWSM